MSHPPRPRPLTTEESLRQMYITGRIELEEFEYAIEQLVRLPDPNPYRGTGLAFLKRMHDHG